MGLVGGKTCHKAFNFFPNSKTDHGRRCDNRNPRTASEIVSTWYREQYGVITLLQRSRVLSIENFILDSFLTITVR
jgi:hypothetical protein